MIENKPKVEKGSGDTTENTWSDPQYHQRRNNNRDQGGKQQPDRIATPRATFKGECP